MKLQIPDQLRVWLGKKYLNAAAPLWKFQGTFIATLQDIRGRQLEHSEEAHKQSRPVDGTRIDYLSLRLFEIYHIEDFVELWARIDDCLPGPKSDLFHKRMSEHLRRSAGSVFGGGSGTLGAILPDGSAQRNFTVPTWVITTLPKEVEYALVKVHSVLPSVLVLVLDVFLTEDATDQLVKRQSMRYLSTVRFRQLIPRNLLFGGYSETSPQSEMATSVFAWLEDLRARLERSLKPLLDGHFMHRPSGRQPRLPAVEVYSFGGLPEEQAAFARWVKDARGWWGSFGFNFDYDLYRNEKLMFWLDEESLNRRGAHRLAVLFEPYLRSLDRAFAVGTDRRRIAIHTGGFLDSLLPTLVLFEFLRSVRLDIERLRQDAFQRMKSSWLSRLWLKPSIKLSSKLHQASLLLDRMSMEFDQQKEAIERQMDRELADLKNITDEEESLRGVILESIAYSGDLLKKHLTLARTAFSNYLDTLNIQANYRLQLTMLCLTVMVGIATIVGVSAVWETPRRILAELAKRLFGWLAVLLR